MVNVEKIYNPKHKKSQIRDRYGKGKKFKIDHSLGTKIYIN